MGRKKKWAIRAGGSSDRDFNRLMKQFKRQSEDRGSADLFFTKPSEERRDDFDKAVKREQKRVEKEALKPLPHQRYG